MFTVTFSHDSQIMEIIFTKRKIKKKNKLRFTMKYY